MTSTRSSATPIDDQHWLQNVDHRLAAPQCDARPDATDISLLVIHNISLPPGKFGGPWIDALFMGELEADAHPYFEGIATLRVSAHLCIFRDGSATQYVPFDRRAWHAGASVWRGRERCNDFSIGIELEGTDDQPFDARQYVRLADVVRALRATYPSLATDAIAGHSDIAPGRKTDPGPCFNWQTLQQHLEHG